MEVHVLHVVQVGVGREDLGHELGRRRIHAEPVTADRGLGDLRLLGVRVLLVDGLRVLVQQRLLQIEVRSVGGVHGQEVQADHVGDVVRQQVDEIDQVLHLGPLAVELVRLQDLVAEHGQQALEGDLGLLLVEQGDVQIAARGDHRRAQPVHLGVVALALGTVAADQVAGHVALELLGEHLVVVLAQLPGAGDGPLALLARVVGLTLRVVEGQHGIGLQQSQDRGVVLSRVVAGQVRVQVDRVVPGVRVAHQAEAAGVAGAGVGVVRVRGVTDTEDLTHDLQTLGGGQIQEADLGVLGHGRVGQTDPTGGLVDEVGVRIADLREDPLVVEQVERDDLVVTRVVDTHGEHVGQRLDVVVEHVGVLVGHRRLGRRPLSRDVGHRELLGVVGVMGQGVVQIRGSGRVRRCRCPGSSRAEPRWRCAARHRRTGSCRPAAGR